MKINAVKGTKDFLPAEMRVRDYVQGEILKIYRAAGYERIATPILEDVENLDKSDGGDNINLVFKILKRGNKLDKALQTQDSNNLSDMGLRYDLTLPLSRYYAANKEVLPSPFKVIQTDRVFRAEQPQKGRMREFVQCDIDVIGDETPNAEVELIDVTARALLAIGFNDFTIQINDRRLLRGMLVGMGFAKDSLDSVCITFDKMDKIGAEGVKKELTEKEFDEKAINSLCTFLQEGDFTLNKVASLCEDKELSADLLYVLNTVEAVSNNAYKIAYNPSLVRGQGYYTGMVFEVTCSAFSGAVAGGGRYDNMVGKFLGQSVPAVGFSIGFERIINILLEQNFVVPSAKQKMVLLYDKGEDFANVLKIASELRENYDVSVLQTAKKVGKQLAKLENTGFNAVCFASKYPEIKMLGIKNEQ